MNIRHIQAMRPKRLRFQVTAFSRYGTPLNRWQFHYANEDGVYEQDLSWIEAKTMPQPLPKNYWLDHKNIPDSYNPDHKNDVRYNFQPQYWPRRHMVHTYKLKVYNYNSLDSIMHGNEWYDMQLDFQIEEPMDSNHYIQHSGHMKAFWAFWFMLIFLFCKSH